MAGASDSPCERFLHRLVAATLVLESGGGFVIVFEGEEEGAPEGSVLVSVSRHESE